ncbi:unnamed protein product [Sphagnum balticum]
MDVLCDGDTILATSRQRTQCRSLRTYGIALRGRVSSCRLVLRVLPFRAHITIPLLDLANTLASSERYDDAVVVLDTLLAYNDTLPVFSRGFEAAKALEAEMERSFRLRAARDAVKKHTVEQSLRHQPEWFYDWYTYPQMRSGRS